MRAHQPPDYPLSYPSFLCRPMLPIIFFSFFFFLTYIFYLYSCLVSSFVSVAQYAHLFLVLSDYITRESMSDHRTAGIGAEGRARRGEEKENLSLCPSAERAFTWYTKTSNRITKRRCHVLEHFQIHGIRRLDYKARVFCRMRFCERGCNYLTRYPNFFSQLCALVTSYRILFRVLSFFFFSMPDGRIAFPLRYDIAFLSGRVSLWILIFPVT